MPTEKRQPLVIVYTGNGKGKTTAALGMLFRAWGRGMRVGMLSFMKSETANFGEERAARRAGIELIPLGAGFTWRSEDLEKDKALAQECWTECKARLSSGDYDILFFDEITYPINFGWIGLEEVLEAIRTRPPDLHVVLTGRDAPPDLIDFADLVTEMREIKHPFQAGIKAQKGVDL